MALTNNLKKTVSKIEISTAKAAAIEANALANDFDKELEKEEATVKENSTPEPAAQGTDTAETEDGSVNAAKIYKLAKALVADLKFMRKKADKGDTSADWKGMIKASTEEYIKAVRKYAMLDK